MPEQYKIRLSIFEGPFDLLLHLLRINEMDINDIRISEITQQYLDYIRVMKELNLEMAGEFLVMASTLLQIKARMLLPVESDEDGIGQDETTEILTTDDLVRQLIEYRQFKEAAALLSDREEMMSQLHFRDKSVPLELPAEAEELSFDVSLLLKAFARVVSIIETPDYNPEIYEAFTVDSKLEYVERLCAFSGEVDLHDVFQRCFNRTELIVTFLAVLEMIAMKKIRFTQNSQFDNITIERCEPTSADEESTPNTEPTAADNKEATPQ